MDRATLAAMTDQTLLSPTAGYEAASAWIEGNREAGFATLCVSPFLVPLAAQRLAGTCTKVGSVAGFPLGFALTESKADEARRLIELGASEIDMVMNIGALMDGEERLVVDDISAVAQAVRESTAGRGVLKVILETGHLTPEQVQQACRLAVEGGADFVKTATGFGPRGASESDVRLMRNAVGDKAGVKASGGIRDLKTALAMIDAGASRIGTSTGLEILAECEAGELAGVTQPAPPRGDSY